MKLRYLFSHFLFFVSLALGVSCTSRKPAQPVILQNTREVVHTIRDTVFHTEADSSFYHAYIDCVNNKPVIKPGSVVQKSGKTMPAPSVILSGNSLEINCEKKAENLFKQWRETYIREHEQKPVYVPAPVYQDKPFTVWQKTQIWFGRAFMGLLAISILIGILRRRNIL